MMNGGIRLVRAAADMAWMTSSSAPVRIDATEAELSPPESFAVHDAPGDLHDELTGLLPRRRRARN